MTLDRLKAEKLARVTADFDGSVFMTRGHAEGTAVGYCKKKKGGRSYYPLFCTRGPNPAVLGPFAPTWYTAPSINPEGRTFDKT